MTEEEVWQYDIEGKNVLIIGPPYSGKTTLSFNLGGYGHQVIHTDDYRRWGYHQALLHVLTAISFAKEKTIVEGVLGYRLLRKGVEFGAYFPDVVVEIKARVSDLHLAMHKGNQTILKEYFTMQNPKYKPEWLIYDRD